ncbi:hypothetical protein EW146_g7187 [Bondarzewia mesenterica]|uniref:FMN hydroxy acid dehydrogenase domain-containing protein n=1 Tax=Bondarzewia mesenterica TaxID=1095465 RepID=A0A4S4LLI8_9AGAM|nr:hypothetical protein EW146_g7187 [Bondarzewia mesenterica]
MDPTNKPKGPSPHYSLYQREVFRRGGEEGALPSFSVHADELVESTKKTLNNRGYFYANSNAGLGWTDKANREAFYRWRIVPRMLVDTNTRDLTTELFGHRIPAPILFAPIGINKLYSPKGELVPARIAGELGLPYCLSTAASQPIEDVAAANDLGASIKNESNSVHQYSGPNGGDAKSPRFFQLYMGHDDEITISLLERAWKSGFDVCMLTVDTWQLGWRPTDISIANYVFYYPGAVGNEVGKSDPVFMKKHGEELEKDSGKWIDSSVWHGKAHTWEKMPWLIKEWKRISNGRPFVIKGIQCVEDAVKAHEVGCEGIVVTNHAGRQVDGAVGSLDVLPEIVEALIDAEMKIIFDSGIRTGPDVFKALALGAHAVQVGRLYVWGMSHEGEAGCRHVMKSLLADLDITMTVAGYQSIDRDVRRNKKALRYNPYERPSPSSIMAPLKDIEKEAILPSTIPTQVVSAPPKRRSKWAHFAGLVLCSLIILHPAVGILRSHLRPVFGDAGAELCPQVEALYPSKNAELFKSLGETLGTEEFKGRAVEWLGGAVRVPCALLVYFTLNKRQIVVYADTEQSRTTRWNLLAKDPRWEAFGPFHDYLLKAYPLIHSTLEITKVNTYGLVYVWKGSDASLKPLLLAAHQDVVPVDPKTVDEWEHPPYSGYFDGTNIWGRGSSDDKSGLIGVMSTIETLLENKFQPTRGIVLSFGFDEETSGLHGAQQLAKHLLSSFGEDAFAMLIDEGGSFSEQSGSIIATPGIAEKGYIDTRIEIASPGGHSSIPPSHTSIGMLSALLVEFEAHPFKVHLSRGTPVYSTVQCLAAHAKDVSLHLRALIKASAHSDKALRKAEKELFKDKGFKALVGTTQAIDLIQGGVKANALPEQAWAVVNHRLATDSSVAVTKQRDTDLLKSLAEQFNLSYTAFGSAISAEDAPAYGTLTLTDAWGTALEPAPITPTDPDAVPYRILSGTIKATYDSHRGLKGGENIVVSPGIMSGNTDTRYYWNLTRHIFRYNHHNSGNGSALANGVHTVNEHIRIVDFVEIIRYFTTLILNVDESTEL